VVWHGCSGGDRGFGIRDQGLRIGDWLCVVKGVF